LDKIVTFSRSVSFQQLVQQIERSVYATLLLNHAGEILSVNKVLLKATGFQWGTIKNKNFNEIILITHIENLYEDYVTNQSNGKTLKIQWKNLNQDIFQSRVSIDKGTDNKGNILYVLNMLDVTPENQLSLIQRFASTMISDINFGVIVIDNDYKLVEISDMACKVLGIKRNESLNQPIDQIFSWIPEEQRIIQKTLLDGVSLRNHPFTWTNNKQRYELIVDTSVLKDELSKVVGAYVIFKDVTNSRSLEQQIQRHDRLAMIGQIAAGTAHEIRNPLTSIKGFLQVLKQTLNEKGLSKETDFTEIMLTEINRINSLVSEFLLLSKPRDIQFQLVDLSSVWKELLPIIETEAILHSVEIENLMDQHLPMVVADRELLKQVFLNICKNGIEAMPDGGTLHITSQLFEEDKKLSINVRDVGPGIPPYAIDKIFDPFFTTKENGTGLGLPVCQRIIHDIGGTIRVSAKGFGTTFSIVIPYNV
jgi:two-component system, sporulation sensor kinase E